MRVTFNVSKETAGKVADSITVRLPYSQTEDSYGEIQWRQHVNPNQHMLVIGTTITVEGERCALWGDHHAEAMAILKQSGDVPTSYQTSDVRLQWHETLADLHQRTLNKWGKLTPVQVSAALTQEERMLLTEARAWHVHVYGGEV